MSNYGLQVFGDGVANFQIDSNTTSTEHLPLRFSSTGTSVGHNLTDAQKAAIYSDGDIVMARPVSGQGSLCMSSLNESGQSLTYPRFSQNADYRIFTTASTAPTNVNSSTHGLTVFNNSNPPVKIFDSRSFSNSIPFTAIYGVTTFDGGAQSASSMNATNNIVLPATTQEKYDKTYVVMNGGVFVGTTVINGFFFDDTNDRILFHSQVSFTLPFANPGDLTTSDVPNFNDIMIGELI